MCLKAESVGASSTVLKLLLLFFFIKSPLIISPKKLLDNAILGDGYPKNIINSQITKKIAQFSTLKQFHPEKCPVYLRVSWIGKPSTNLEKSQNRRGKLLWFRQHPLGLYV